LRQMTDDPEEDDAPRAAPERQGIDLRHAQTYQSRKQVSASWMRQAGSCEK
jgi:hypothetical protein